MPRRKRLVFKVSEVSRGKEVYRLISQFSNVLQMLLHEGKGPLSVEVKVYEKRD